MSELLSVGYAVIDSIDGTEYMGGAAAGIAINGKKLGLDTGLLSVFGDDSQSKSYYEYLEDAGIDLSPSQVFPDTSIPTIEISHANRTMGWKNDDASKFMPTMPVESRTINAYEVVHLASAHFSLAERIADMCRYGIITYSPGPNLQQNPDYLSIGTLRKSDVIFLNDTEWNVVSGLLNLERPAGLIDYGPSVVVTTHGACGSVISYRESIDVEEHIPVKEIDKAETTGAGDALALGFITGYINKFPLRTCGEMGAELARFALQCNGVIVDDSHLQKFIQATKDNYGLNITGQSKAT